MNHFKNLAQPIALGALMILGASVATAQSPTPIESAPSGGGFDLMNNLLIPFLLATLWTVLGIILFAVSIKLMVILSPFSVQKEIEEDQNTSLGIIMGSVILGIAIILAAAILG